MQQRTVFHVVPTDRGWTLQREGDSYGVRYYATKTQAVQEGEREALARTAELIIHNDDGRIEEQRSFGEQETAR